MRLGLRIAAYTTFISAVIGTLATYQLFTIPNLLKGVVDLLDLVLFVMILCRFLQFFGSVMTM